MKDQFSRQWEVSRGAEKDLCWDLYSSTLF